MGASESKLTFKQGIFRLSEEQSITANDPYWTGVRHIISDDYHSHGLPLHSFGNYLSPQKMSSVSSPVLIYDGLAMHQ